MNHPDNTTFRKVDQPISDRIVARPAVNAGYLRIKAIGTIIEAYRTGAITEREFLNRFASIKKGRSR